MMTDGKKGKALAANAAGLFDRVMGAVRGFFTNTMAELGRCSWPSRSELFESTVLVVITIVVTGFFVAGVDTLARYFIKFITTGSF